MKWALVVLMSFFFFAQNVKAERLTFTFYDDSGMPHESKSIGKDLSETYSTKLNPKIFLVFTPDFHNKFYIKQEKLLFSGNGAETLQLIQVIAPIDFEPNAAYHLKNEDVKRQFPNKRLFEVYLLDETGNVIKRWESPVTLNQIKSAIKSRSLTHHSSGTPKGAP